MGYGSYVLQGGVHVGEWGGYNIGTVCDEAGCGKAIDRGLSYLCGQEPGGSDDSCGGYFCSEHLWYTGFGQRCQTCDHEYFVDCPACEGMGLGCNDCEGRGQVRKVVDDE